MQHANAKFDRRDPWPTVPFAFDDAESVLSLTETLGWIMLGACFMTLCVLFLGVA